MSLTDWADQLETPAGIGVDMVEIAEIRALDARTGGAFVKRTFTGREQAEAKCAPDCWSYLAGRFAAKEAVFKAMAPLVPERTFDFRIVETLREPDGSPQVQIGDALREVMERAQVSRLLVSVTNEGGFAFAFAAAVR